METPSPISIRRLRADEWPAYRELRLRALADSPDAFCSTLELEEARPDQHWADRVSSSASSQLLLVAESGAERVGLALGVIAPAQPEIARVFQMWIAPEARRRGCATLLLDALLLWARGAKATVMALSVTCGNSSAQRLYERAGFIPHGAPEPLRPGSPERVQPMILML